MRLTGDGGWAWYLGKRVLSLAIVVLLLATATFAIFFIQEGPMQGIVPKGGSPELVNKVRVDLKLDEPIPVQYVNFMAKSFSGRFFLSPWIWKGSQIGDKIYTPLSKTLELFGVVLASGLLIGSVLGGLTTGEREGKLPSRFIRLISLGLACAPIMSLALLVFYMMAGQRTIPVSRSIILPLIASLPIAIGTYILICKGKDRYFDSRITGPGHPRPTSSITKLYAAWVMIIVLVADLMFSYGGLGELSWQSAVQRDGPTLIACTFLILMTMASTNFLLDIITPFLKSRFCHRAGESAADPSPSTEEPELPTVDTQREPQTTMRPSVIGGFAKSPLAVIALVILLIFIVLAVAAPWLATVPNPDRIASREPSDLQSGSINPLPPSLGKSAKTGFIHPLGTDTMGMDVYSDLLYGVGAPLLMVAVLTAITLAVGVVVWIMAVFASSLKGAPAFIIGGAMSVFADFIIAIPISVYFLARTFPNNSQVALSYTLLVVFPLLVFVLTFRIARAKMHSIRAGPLGPESQSSVGKLGWVLRQSMGSILYLSKFVVMLGFITLLIMQFLAMANDQILMTSWVTLTSIAFNSSAAIAGAWWLIVPQLVMTALVAGSAYKILDTLEQEWVKRFGIL